MAGLKYFVTITAGADQLYKDVEAMIGYKPSLVWKFAWMYITPLFVLASSHVTGCKKINRYMFIHIFQNSEHFNSAAILLYHREFTVFNRYSQQHQVMSL